MNEVRTRVTMKGLEGRRKLEVLVERRGRKEETGYAPPPPTHTQLTRMCMGMTKGLMASFISSSVTAISVRQFSSLEGSGVGDCSIQGCFFKKRNIQANIQDDRKILIERTLISGMEILFWGSFSSSLSSKTLASGDIGTSGGYSTGLLCMMSYKSTTFLATNGTWSKGNIKVNAS